jgi:hypothetical protein
VLKKKIQPAFRRIGITDVGWHTFQHLVYSSGGNGRKSTHDPRPLAASQSSCHEEVPAGEFEDQTIGAGQIGRRNLADGYFAEDKPNPMKGVRESFRMGPFSCGAYRPLTSPDLLEVRLASA